MRKRNLGLGTILLIVLVWIVVIALVIYIVTDAISCANSGGTFVKGFPWYICIK